MAKLSISSGNTVDDPYDTDLRGTCFDIDECAKDPNGFHRDRCNSLASCHNNEGSYTCTCVDGYEGNGRGLYGCADINEW